MATHNSGSQVYTYLVLFVSEPLNAAATVAGALQVSQNGVLVNGGCK